MKKVIVITGPTATGKTSVSIELAKLLGTEIISADSMQVYKFMNIGTAKPDEKEMQGIPHHLIDEVYPDEDFSVARFKEAALKYIEDVISKGKIPVVVGGTGQYISSLIYNINYSDTYIDKELRNELLEVSKNKGNEYLHRELEKIDYEAAERIHFNDVKRVIRAIEVFKQTNKPISYHREQSRLEPPAYNFLVYGIRMDRGRMYERINKRVNLMLESGLVEEVKYLVSLGYSKIPSMQGLGYKEIGWYLRGESTLDEASELLKRNTRRFSKRQLTWFRRMDEIKWIDVNDNTQMREIVKLIQNDIATTGIIL